MAIISSLWWPYRPYSIVLLMVWQLVSVRPLQRRVFTIQKICSYGIQFYVVVYFVLRCWCSHLLCQVVFIFHSILCICLVVYLCICIFLSLYCLLCCCRRYPQYRFLFLPTMCCPLNQVLTPVIWRNDAVRSTPSSKIPEKVRSLNSNPIFILCCDGQINQFSN